VVSDERIGGQKKERVMCWVSRESPISGRMIRMFIHSSEQEIIEWQMRFIRNPDMDHSKYFPHLPEYQIEFLRSGICNSEWEEYFGEQQATQEDRELHKNRV
jgi:hypothetical protein